MAPCFRLLPAGWVLTAPLAAAAPALPAPPADPAPTRADFMPLCGDCHADGVAKGGFSLEQAFAPADPKAQEKMLLVLADGRMPPVGADQPDEAERGRLGDRLRAALAANPAAQPTAKPMRRLTPEELDHTWGAVLGTPVAAARAGLPAPPLALGFDTVAAPTTTEADLERLVDAAGAALSLALGGPAAEERLNGADFKADGDRALPADGGDVKLTTNGVLRGRFQAPAPGRYRLTVATGQDRAGDENARFNVHAAGRKLGDAEVDGKPRSFEIEVPAAGAVEVQVRFTNDFWNPATRADRNFILRSVALAGPLPDASQAARRARWLPAAPPPAQESARAAGLLAAFAAEAWRGAAPPEALARLQRVFAQGRARGDDFEEALRSAYAAALCSPRCTCLVERADPAAPLGAPRVDAATLAERLSYFLWAGPPDAALRQNAAALADPARRRTEAARLLADPRAERFAERFTGQWLQTRALDEAAPAVFPGWSPEWRRRLQREVTLVFLATLRGGQPSTALLDRRTTFVDAALAGHYGLPAPTGDGFAEVPLPPGRPAGVLTSAAVLVLTSNPDRTNPVLRGKWVMEVLLGAGPPPPPPQVPALPGAADGHGKALGMRARLEAHRRDPDCRACHERMDPLGLALESFDAAGRLRAHQDPGGDWPGGGKMASAADIRDLVLAHPERFERVLLERLFTYALGRAPAPAEHRELEALRRRARGDAPAAPLAALVTELVASDLFRSLPTGGTP